jgi:UDP-N-acetylglucosamine 4,6-dehydratase
MVPEDDGRSTVEIDDRFVLLPAGHHRRMADWTERGATKVADGFAYSSDLNTEVLDEMGILEMLAKTFPGESLSTMAATMRRRSGDLPETLADTDVSINTAKNV